MDIISVGGEYGGADIPGWLKDEQIQLNKLLDKHCKKPYNRQVTSIILALRVEGQVKSFGFVGIDDVRRHRAQKAVGADISVQRKDWKVDPADYRNFLWQSVQKGIWACVARLTKDKLVVDEERLRSDLVKVERAFLRK